MKTKLNEERLYIELINHNFDANDAARLSMNFDLIMGDDADRYYKYL